jgi:hypothetical protein
VRSASQGGADPAPLLVDLPAAGRTGAPQNRGPRLSVDVGQPRTFGLVLFGEAYGPLEQALRDPRVSDPGSEPSLARTGIAR